MARFRAKYFVMGNTHDSGIRGGLSQCSNRYAQVQQQLHAVVRYIEPLSHLMYYIKQLVRLDNVPTITRSFDESTM